MERNEVPALGGPVGDPMTLKAEADRIVERAAADLRARLQQSVARLQPFPPFPGAFFTYAIEAEPDGATRTDRGCVVVCEDGELYELRIGVDLETLALGGFEDPVSLRKEELTPIDLHPRDYVVYAYNALTAVLERLMEQADRGVREGAPPGANRDLQ